MAKQTLSAGERPVRSRGSGRIAKGSGKGRSAAGRGHGSGRGRGSGRRRRASRSWLRRLLVAALVLAIWLGLGVSALVAYYAYTLPDLGRIALSTRRPSVKLLAGDGSTIALFGDLYGEAVTLADLPPYLPQAVLAVEDRRFFSHPGIDPLGLARAMLANLRAGRIVEGGSTITQQLAKNLFLSAERSFGRKARELLLALWLEHRFSKKEILALYLNRVYFGAGTYGVDAAARRFFGKSAGEVGLYEAAMLAGLVKAPSRYNPATDRDLAHARALLVLRAMVDAHYLTPEKAATAARERRQGHPPMLGHGRHFADWVLGQVNDQIAGFSGDVVVRTTLDPRIQAIAEEETRRLLAEADARDVSEAAVVVMRPDGAVLAMVGGRDYADSQFNRAVQALRQPGSAFKLFVYLAALEEGLVPDSRVLDAPVSVTTPTGVWTPKNYGERYAGEVTLREAFARSLNTAAVRVLQYVGAEEVAAVARRLGITSPLDTVPSLALGSSETSLLETTAAFAVLANQGYGVWPYGLAGIATPENRILYRREGGGPGRLLAPEVVEGMLDMLRATVVWGTGRGADPGRPAAGKTGTSQDFRDAWFIGFTADHVVGVWLGNDDGHPMRQVTGGSLPSLLWRRIVMRAEEDLEPRSLPLPGSSEVAGSEREGGSLIDRIVRSLRNVAEPGEQPAWRSAPPAVGRPTLEPQGERRETR